MQFGVNHLGHWALTAQLMPAILDAAAPRVVTVTSTAHHMGRAVNPSNPHLEGNYGPWKAYGQSKLANFHFGLGLQKEFAKAGVAAPEPDRPSRASPTPICRRGRRARTRRTAGASSSTR